MNKFYVFPPVLLEVGEVFSSAYIRVGKNSMKLSGVVWLSWTKSNNKFKTAINQTKPNQTKQDVVPKSTEKRPRGAISEQTIWEIEKMLKTGLSRKGNELSAKKKNALQRRLGFAKAGFKLLKNMKL